MVPTESVQDLAAARAADDAVVLDVREAFEFTAGHVPGAILLPLGQLMSRIDEVPTGSLIHVICQSGNRSGVATELLMTKGFQATNVAGGTGAWRAAGYPVEQGSPNPGTRR